MDTTPENIPWYKSNILRGIAISMLAQILTRFHVTASLAPLAAQLVDTALDIISIGAAGYAAYSRANHPLPALTTTQTKADLANGVLNAKSQSVSDQPVVAAPIVPAASGESPSVHAAAPGGDDGPKP